MPFVLQNTACCGLKGCLLHCCLWLVRCKKRIITGRITVKFHAKACLSALNLLACVAHVARILRYNIDSVSVMFAHWKRADSRPPDFIFRRRPSLKRQVKSLCNLKAPNCMHCVNPPRVRCRRAGVRQNSDIFKADCMWFVYTY